MNPSLIEPEDEVGFWELRRGNVKLATIKESWQDFPWVYCSIFPEEVFETYRHFFARAGGEWRGRERELHSAIAREEIHLITRDGQQVTAFTLVVEASEARLTFSEV